MLIKLKRKFILVTMSIVLVMLAIIFGMLYSFTKADLEKGNVAVLEIVTQAARQPMGFEWLARKQALPMQLSQDGLEECVFVFVLQREI